MLSRIFATALIIIAAMIAVQRGALRTVGLTGSCTSMQTLTDGSTWVACKAGKLAGRPSLSSKSCSDAGVRGKLEWWHCPAAIVSSAAGR
jgi:hypothetical protein